MRTAYHPLLLELPEYHWPNLRNLLIGLWERARIFLTRVGTIILSLMIVLWFLSSFPAPPPDATGPAVQYSIAGYIGRGLEYVFAPIGFNWQISLALVPGLAALARRRSGPRGSAVRESLEMMLASNRAARANVRIFWMMLPVFLVPMLVGVTQLREVGKATERDTWQMLFVFGVALVASVGWNTSRYFWVMKPEQRRLEAQERSRRSARLGPLQAQIRGAEAEMARLGEEKTQLEKRLAAPDIYADARKEELKQCLVRRALLEQQLAEAEERWLTLTQQLETLQAVG